MDAYAVLLQACQRQDGVSKQKNTSNYFATAFSRHSLDPIRFSRSVTGRFADQPVQFEQLVELISRRPRSTAALLRLPWHCFRAATKSRCESSLNCSSWSASFDSGDASRCATSNGESSCRTHSVLPVKTPRLRTFRSSRMFPGHEYCWNRSRTYCAAAVTRRLT